MKIQEIIIGFSLAVMATSCSSSEKEKSNPKAEGFKDSATSMAFLMVEQQKIDSLGAKTWDVGQTLSYSKNNQEESFAVELFMANNQVEKYSVTFRENGQGGRRDIYLKDGKMVSFKDLLENSQNPQKPYMIERYGKIKDGKVTDCVERMADFEEDLPKKEFIAKSPTDAGIAIDEAKIKRCINQEEEFQLTFQGFLDSSSDLFMFVGEPKPGKDAFVAAIFIDIMDQLIMDMKASPKSFMNRKLKVTFEPMTQSDGLSIQRYTGGKLE